MKDCTICFEQIWEGYQKTTIPYQCNHTFHTKCIGPWLDKNKKSGCPNCRSKLKSIVCSTIKIENLNMGPLTIEKYTLQWNNKNCFQHNHELILSRVGTIPFGVLMKCITCNKIQMFNYKG
tara:strand:- start:421 stop:783 length:363 start_codon:yes stop_codon:yes gene_type:complete